MDTLQQLQFSVSKATGSEAAVLLDQYSFMVGTGVVAG